MEKWFDRAKNYGKIGNKEYYDYNQYLANGGVNMDTGVDMGMANSALVNQVTQQIIDLENQLNSIPNLALSDTELDDILKKATDQVTPYYEKKQAEIEKGIKEGKIRSAEDLLMQIRDVEAQTKDKIAQYDLSTAQTNEELANKLADITATSQEDLAMKRDDWRQRIDQAKGQQVKSDILTSGIGKKQIQDLLTRQQMEEQAIQRRADTATTEANTTAKYDLASIQQARQAAEAERIRRIGTPDQTAATTTALRGTLGLADGAALPSDTEIARQRADRNVTVARPEDLTTLGEQKKQAVESRRQSLIADEQAIRQQQELAKRQSITASMAAKQRQLNMTLSNYS